MQEYLKKTMSLVTFALVIILATHAEADPKKYQRTVENYAMPDVVLVNQEGKKVRFKELMKSDKPVIVDFIFGTCTTICPILSASYTNFQRKLGSDTRRVQLVSISIDPENDTPKVMRDYLKRYQSKPGWDFLTGSRADIDKVMYAFKAYIPNKMSHYPLTLIRSPGENTWIRVFGLMSSTEFLNECQKVGIK